MWIVSISEVFGKVVHSNSKSVHEDSLALVGRDILLLCSIQPPDEVGEDADHDEINKHDKDSILSPIDNHGKDSQVHVNLQWSDALS